MELLRRLRVRVLIALATAAPVIAATFGVSALLAPQPAHAVQTIPYKINFQGRLTDNNGNVLSDGTYNVKFRIFNVASGGTSLWEEDWVSGSPDHRITVQNGLFNVQFGSITTLDPAVTALFNSSTQLFLEVELPTPGSATGTSPVWTEGAMTPRQPLSSSPYAFNSDMLDGLDSSAFGQLGAANTFTASNIFAPTAGSTVALTVKATTAGSTNSLEVFDSSGSRQAYFDANGNLNLARTLQATASNTIDLGATATTFRTGYFGTSIVTPAVNAATTGGTVTTNAGTLQRTASGTFTIDLNDSGNTTLAVNNSGAGVASLTVDGQFSVGSFAAATSTPVCSNAGTLATCNSNPSGVTLQQAYAAGNTISTTGNDVGITLNSSQNFSVATATGATGYVSITRSDGSGTSDPAQLLLVKNLDVDRPQPVGIKIDAANTNGKITTAIDASSANITNALSVGANAILGTTGAINYNNFDLSSLGDLTSGFTQLDGSSTTSGTGNSKTSMVLTSVTNFDVGNYIQLQDSPSTCDTTATTCYAKITAVNSGTNTLTITPALSWGSGKAVVEMHLPEVGGTDTASTLTNRYGRGYFIAGVATGNGTTYYNEDSIDTSLASFDLLNDSSLTTLNVGNAATTVNVPGALQVSGQAIVNSSGQINGAQLQAATVANAALTNSSLTVGTTGNLSGGGSVALGGSLTLNTVNNPNFSTSVTTPQLFATSSIQLQPTTDSTTALQVLTSTGAGSRGVLVVGTSNTQVSADANLIVNSSVNLPTLTSVAFTSNSAGTLAGTPGASYFYRVSAIVGSETAASAEQWINTSNFTTLSAPAAPTAVAGSAPGITGTWTYKYTYTTGNGETSASPASANITVSNKKVTVTVANGPTGTTSKKIYRTTTGPGVTGWFLVGTIANNTTTTFTDNTADAGLGTGTPPVGNTATTDLNSVTLTFPAFPSATGYRIFRGTSTHGEDHYQTAGSCSGTCTFTDSGATGTAGAPIEPTAGRVGIGTAAPDYALDVAGNVSASNAYIASGNVGQTQTCGAGGTFSGLTITGGIVTAIGSCASLGGGSGATATLQTAYDNSSVPQINLSSGGGPLTVADTSGGLGTDLFDVQNNAGTTNYLGVSATGASVTGNLNITGTYEVGGTPISTSTLSNGSSVTLQGNTFNGNTQLVQTTSGGALPAISGTNLTALNPTNFATASGAITLTSGGSSGITLDSASNVIQIAANDTTLQRVTAGTNLTYTIDLKDSTSSNTTLAVANSGTGVANLTVDGTINGATISGGTVSGGSLSGTAVNGLTVSAGTITGGTWQGTAVAATSGGTGQSTFAIGDLLYASSSSALSKLSEPGSAGSCLVSGATGVSAPTWSSCSSAAGAATSLNNLVATSINQSLIADTNNTRDLGSASIIWGHTYTGVLDAGTTTTTLTVGATNATSIAIGNTTTATATSIQGGTTGGIAIGSTGSATTGSTIHLADTSNATGTQAVTIGSNANTANTIDIDAGTGASAIEIGDTNTAHGIKIGANAVGVQTIAVGNSVSGSQTTLAGGVLATSGAQGVVIGAGFGSDTTLVPLILDSSSSFAETASTCTASVNDGALYYNSNANSNAIRGCVNGNWEDVVTTSGLGIITFGVVPDSATGTGVGDLAGAGASAAADTSSGPCKVYLGSAAKTIRWTGCTAYSGGRKVVVTAQSTDLTLTTTSTSWAHVCLTGAGNQPAVSAFGTETAPADLPTFSVNNPVLCLADILTGNGQGNITGIYDTRTFTTSTHEFAQSTTALALGVPVIPSGLNVAQVGASATANIQGIVVASHGDTTGTPNVIIATGGPVWAKATAGTAGAVVITSTTAGRATTGTSVAGPYGDMGLARSTYNATCTANIGTNCQTSIFFDFFPR